MPQCGRLVSHEPWPKGVKEYLESAVRIRIRARHSGRLPDLRKENLPQNIVEKNQLQPRREISIYPILPQILVMFEVIPLHHGQPKLHDRRI